MAAPRDMAAAGDETGSGLVPRTPPCEQAAAEASAMMTRWARIDRMISAVLEEETAPVPHRRREVTRVLPATLHLRDFGESSGTEPEHPLAIGLEDQPKLA